MSENYEVYESRRHKTPKKRHNVSKGYKNRLKKQTVFSVVCLLIIYIVKISASPVGNTINNSIKYALEYKVNTEKIQLGITSMLDKIVK